MKLGPLPHLPLHAASHSHVTGRSLAEARRGGRQRSARGLEGEAAASGCWAFHNYLPTHVVSCLLHAFLHYDHGEEPTRGSCKQ